MTGAGGHVEELLDRYRTGELDLADRRRVEGHLEECEACRSALASLEEFSETVGRAYAAEAASRAVEHEPDWGRMRAAIAARTTAPPRRSWLARHVPQAAAAIVALIALGVLWQQGIRSPEEADRALRTEGREALSDRDARPADRSSGALGPGAAEPDTTAGAELDRLQPAQDEARLTKRDAAEPLGERLDDREGARRQNEAGAAARKPAPVAEAIEGEAEAAAAGARDDSAVSRARFEARADSNMVAAEAPVLADEVEITVTGQAKMATPPPDLERFHSRARLALAAGDSALAAAALAQWRDSLSAGEDLPPDLRRAAEALADSLAAFLAARP